ncbi:hypothetical protein HDU67_005480 [Dinochytrium kinnereticum]|nr:hypothetical protein HDU67_005480 [Dinochytrium kinnereticum]
MAVVAAPMPFLRKQEVFVAATDDDIIRTPPFVDWDQYNEDQDSKDDEDDAVHTPPFRPIPPGNKSGHPIISTVTADNEVRIALKGEGFLHVLPFTDRNKDATVVFMLESVDGKLEIVPEGGPRAASLAELIEDVVSKESLNKGYVHILPVNEGGDVKILPIKENDGDVSILPIIDDDGEVSILPIEQEEDAREGEVDVLPINDGKDDDEVHILPVKDGEKTDDDEFHVLPIEKGEVHIFPIEGSVERDDEIHILPIKDIKRTKDDEFHILPIKKDHSDKDGDEVHILPITNGDDKPHSTSLKKLQS